MAELVRGARAAGFDAVKVEPLDDCVPVERIEDFVSRAREAAGPEAELHLDFGYRFADAEEAAASILPLVELEPGFVETPLPADDADEYARLAELVPLPLAASELFESEWEHAALLRHGALAIAQPWPNRVGVTGTLHVAEEARRLGRRTVLAGWNATAVGEALSVHLAAAGLGPGLALEHAPAEAYGEGAFPLRAIAGPEPARDGAVFRLPDTPGLGVELDA
jgi:galactonate dehydratase